MTECVHLPDYVGEKCTGCGEEIDEYGNTENDFRFCCFPDCGCDGARLCMAGEASERACKFNGEGMYHSSDPKARMAFADAYYSGEFDRDRDATPRKAEGFEAEGSQPGPKGSP